MFSFLSSYNQARQQSKLLKAQASIMRANARGTRNRANSQAYNIEEAARKNQLIEAENLAAARTNQRAKVGSVRAARAHSGFTNEGSGQQAERNAQQELDKYILNMAQSASIAMANAWQQASDTRRQGEIDARIQEAEADQYQAQAKNIRRAANISLVSGILGTAAGAYFGAEKANSFNKDLSRSLMKEDAALTNAFDRGEISWEQMQAGLAKNEAYYQQHKANPFESAFLTGSILGGSAYHTTASFSPFIASYSADNNARKNNWGGMLSVLTGNVPYRVPAAGTIFSQYI